MYDISNICNVYIHLYIYIIYIYIWYPPPARPIYNFRAFFRAPPHENCRSLRGGASRWAILVNSTMAPD